MAINQVGNKHGITIYPIQSSDAQSACNQEARTFSVSNQSNHVITGINMVNSVTNSQTFGSKSSATPLSVLPSKGPIVGSTDLRYHKFKHLKKLIFHFIENIFGTNFFRPTFLIKHMFFGSVLSDGIFCSKVYYQDFFL